MKQLSMTRSFLKLRTAAVAAGILSVASAWADTTHVGGLISANTTWTTDTVIVDNSLIVDSGATLTIAPGTVVITEDEQSLTVRGRLLAIGTEQDTIRFTTASTSRPWHGIRFVNVGSLSDTSKFLYCRVELAQPDYNGIIGSWGGGFTIKMFSKVIIAHSNIALNGGRGMYRGGGIHCSAASPIIIDCLFYGNSVDGADAYGGALYLENASPAVANTRFLYNSAHGSMSTAAGIACYAGSAPLIANCLFTRNVSDGAVSDGGAIVCSGSNPRIVNCTIALNGSPTSSSYGQAGLVRASSPQITNTIFWGNNFLPILINDTASHPVFRSCSMEGPLSVFGSINATGIFVDTIMGNPAFIDTTAGDFQLRSTSRCVNAGTVDTAGLGLPSLDLAGNERIAGGRVDIGAYELAGVARSGMRATKSTTLRASFGRTKIAAGPWGVAVERNGASFDGVGRSLGHEPRRRISP